MSKLKSNTAALNELLAAVNNLPDAGAGGGLELCDVTINNMQDVAHLIFAYVENGEMTQYSAFGYVDSTFHIPKGTLITVYSMYYYNWDCQGDVSLFDIGEDGNLWVYLVGGDGSLTFA